MCSSCLWMSRNKGCILGTYIKKIKHFGTSVVLYGCETWSLTIREDHRLGY
jgi:hypothetical protein